MSYLAFHPMFAAGIFTPLHHFVSQQKIHPILVNFTAALIPVSFGSDLLALIFHEESLRDTAWWTMLFAAIVTPLTAMTGWLFWAKDDSGAKGMLIHKWLGTSFVAIAIVFALWRWSYYREKRWASAAYLAVLLIAVLALMLQGHLGGEKAFS